MNVIADMHPGGYFYGTNNMTPKRIVIVGYDDITSLDLTGPLEAFSSAFLENSNGNPQPCYEVTIAASGREDFHLRVRVAHDRRLLRKLLAPHGYAPRSRRPGHTPLSLWS